MNSKEKQIETLVALYTPQELAEILVETEDALEDYRIRAIMFYETPAVTFSRRLGDWWQKVKGGSDER